MLKLLRRNEGVGLQTIGLCWHEAPWARKAIELRLWRPTPHKDPARPFRFVVELVWGPGSGYIGGLTAFLAINCKDRRPGPDGGLPRGVDGDLLRTPLQVGVAPFCKYQVPYVY